MKESAKGGDLLHTENDAAVPGDESAKGRQDGNVRPDLLENPQGVVDDSHSDADGGEEYVWLVRLPVKV